MSVTTGLLLWPDGRRLAAPGNGIQPAVRAPQEHERARRKGPVTKTTRAAVVAVLVVLNWGTVRAHIEAWRFQLTRKTAVIDLGFGDEGHDIDYLRSRWSGRACEPCDLLQLLCSSQDDSVIADSEDVFQRIWWSADEATLRGPLDTTPDLVRRILVARGYRVLEQCFPRRAYVVIGSQAFEAE